MVTKEKTITIAMMLLITYTLSLSLVNEAFPAGQQTTKISNNGTINIQTSPGLGVYADEQNSPLNSIAWGTLQPGESQNISLYLKNEGDLPIKLSLEVSNWHPTIAGDYLSVTWDYDDQSLEVNELRQVTLTLSVSSEIENIESFTFDLVIYSI